MPNPRKRRRAFCALAAPILIFQASAIGAEQRTAIIENGTNPAVQVAEAPPPFHPNDPSQRLVPDSTPELSAKFGPTPRRGQAGPQQLVDVSSERGFSISSSFPVQGVYAGHSASTLLIFPPSSGPNTDRTLYITTMPSASISCLESLTAYFRYSQHPSTIRQWRIYDWCTGAGFNTPSKTIDSVFLSNYVRNVGGNESYFTEVVVLGDGLLHVLLFNFNTSTWEDQYAVPPAQVWPNGWTFFEYEHGPDAGCPAIPRQHGLDLQVLVDGVWQLLTPTYSFDYASSSGCFVSGGYVFEVHNANYNWSVFWP